MVANTRRKLRTNARRAEPGQELSETEVLRLLIRYLKRQEIADSLCLSVNTVKSHLRSAFTASSAPPREKKPWPAPVGCAFLLDPSLG
jgi:DNA-binding CsgD family transcriptional regulator